jgi:hypothetical protein
MRACELLCTTSRRHAKARATDTDRCLNRSPTSNPVKIENVCNIGVDGCKFLQHSADAVLRVIILRALLLIPH